MNFNKKKVVFVMGATGTGKTKLSVDLAVRFSGEAINSDKIQVYKGLDTATNKITDQERRGIPHHLLGFLDPGEDFPVEEFCRLALDAIEKITEKGHLPIIVGGSNTYIEALVDDNAVINFRARFDCCFLWMDVSFPVLYKRLGDRLDQMVDAGLVDEARELFHPNADYTCGVRRAIGAPELHEYLLLERGNRHNIPADNREKLLKKAVQEMKDNTCRLVDRQVGKIQRLRDEVGWEIHRIDATRVFDGRGKNAGDAWKENVLKPGVEIVGDFLKGRSKKNNNININNNKWTVRGGSYFTASWMILLINKFLLAVTRFLRARGE